MKFLDVRNKYVNLQEIEYEDVCDELVKNWLISAMENYIDIIEKLECTIEEWDELDEYIVPKHILMLGKDNFSKTYYKNALTHFQVELNFTQGIHYKYIQNQELKELLDVLMRDVEVELNNIKKGSNYGVL